MKFTQKMKLLFSNDGLDNMISMFLSGADVETNDTTMSNKRALKYSAVFACCRVLAETYASVPLLLYKKNGIEREAVSNLTIYDVLHNAPNEEMSPFNFKEAMMMSLNLGGNSVCEKLVNKAGEIVGLYPYPSSAVTITRDENNLLIYKIKLGAKEKILYRSQVLHIPNMSLDGVIGLSPISYAASAINLGLSYEDYGINFYKNAAMPSGSFNTDGKLTEPAFLRLKEELKLNYTGLKKAGIPIILEEGLKFNQFSVNAVDAQLLESKYFQIEDICRVFRVPQHLVQLLNKSTFSNIEQQSLEFVVYTMLPIFKRFEECMNAQLLTQEQRKAGYFLEHKIDGLLRGDSAARSAFMASGRQWGWLSANDCRRLENLPSVVGGDVYLTPLNMQDSSTLGDDAGKQTDSKTISQIGELVKGR